MGQPTSYRVTVYQLTASGGATSSQYVTEVVTTGTSLPMPPGLLTTGAYVFVITALASPTQTAAAPFRMGPAFASADAVTGVATVP